MTQSPTVPEASVLDEDIEWSLWKVPVGDLLGLRAEPCLLQHRITHLKKQLMVCYGARVWPIKT